jgi:heme/copper-type cytochrome/quinol oxidase subunit 2
MLLVKTSYYKNPINLLISCTFIIRESKVVVAEYLLTSRYSFETSQYILLPQYSFIRLLIYSFDVIHTLGCYSIGIKIDAIPGRINLATTVRLLNGGECRGNCFESCGQGHLPMSISSIVVSRPL